MNTPDHQQPKYVLALADGITWVIAAGDDQAVPIVSCLEKTMQLRVVASDQGESSDRARDNNGAVRHLTALSPAYDLSTSRSTRIQVIAPDNASVICVLPATAEDEALFLQLLDLSLVLARDAETRGGMLLHGALAERDGIGVVLAAPGGTGKSTASDRLPSPWHSLCDDSTLVVRDGNGTFWAHPWPTWSRFLTGGPGGTWNVPRAVPLKAIFFLSQSETERTEPVGSGRAATLLMESAQQVGHPMTRGLQMDQVRALHLKRFDNACALAQIVPAYLLHLSLTGKFWLEIERVLLERGNKGE